MEKLRWHYFFAFFDKIEYLGEILAESIKGDRWNLYELLLLNVRGLFFIFPERWCELILNDFTKIVSNVEIFYQKLQIKKKLFQFWIDFQSCKITIIFLLLFIYLICNTAPVRLYAPYAFSSLVTVWFKIMSSFKKIKNIQYNHNFFFRGNLSRSLKSGTSLSVVFSACCFCMWDIHANRCRILVLNDAKIYSFKNTDKTPFFITHFLINAKLVWLYYNFQCEIL